MADFDSDDFDDWYRSIIGSPTRDALVEQWLGLPATVHSTGFLTGDGLAEVLDALGLAPAAMLVELGCGRAGYGLAAVQSSEAYLVGVDFSPVAIGGAQARAEELQLTNRASFEVGDLTDSGLRTGLADAVLCIDAIHFASSVTKAVAECRRLLVPGGRVVITTWEAVEPHGSAVPDRIQRMDLGRDLERAGFVDVQLLDRPRWKNAEVAFWTAAAALEPGDDPALMSLKREGAELLPLGDALRRILVIAETPPR